MDFPYDILLLIVAGVFAGFINTMAGGGSLLTLPLLIFLGLPSATANGTNRIAILVATTSAILGFRSKKINSFPLSLYLGITALLGALIGARIAVDIDGLLFNKILAVIMIVVVMLMVFKPHYTTEQLVPKTSGKTLVWSMVAFFFIGIYGGFINAGIGFIMMLFLNYVNRMDLVRVNATKVSVALIYTTGALATFALSGNIEWKYGIALASGNAAGAYFASRYSVKKGEGIITKVMMVMVITMAIKLWFF
ncbi:MAG: sulfite exporter TauE/SafE family protein [Flavobacteriaceae bacterium]